jgi:CO dehydrogenase nickel-insertion accessory protein CooC1
MPLEDEKVMTASKVLMGKRIGVLGKGGSGKSTVVVLLAHALRCRGYEVCVLDADSTNIGLYRALGLDSSPRSLLDYFGGMVFRGGSVTCPVDDPTPLPGAETSLVQLADEYVGRNPEGIYLLTAGKIGDQGPGAGCDGPISKIARDLRIRSNGDAPVMLIDFKAGFEDVARGAVATLDWALAVVDPTAAAMQIAVHLKGMIERIKAGELPATSHLENLKLVEMANRVFREALIKDVLVILNRLPAKETEEYMKSYLEMRKIEPIGILHEYPKIAVSWLKGMTLDWTDAEEDVQEVLERLETIADEGRTG